MNTADPATHLEDAQCMGRDVGNIERWITLKHYAEAQDRAVYEVELDESTEEDGQIDMVNMNFIKSNAKSPAIIAKLKLLVTINSEKISYQVDTGSNNNILPFHIYKILSLDGQKAIAKELKVKAIN